ncbi:MAG: YihA family ribosome biogenesis GTP-binding protein [Bacteroidales bacterium]|nr:YihA family ribosome biogenesis GTP-binding protein [Bacteroidales bacterium]
MEIHQAEYVVSSTTIKQCPQPDKPEYAFIGRSNVGKSSLINMLTGQKKLARISGTPGKTITINHYLINKAWYLVDLPGYGYAKRSKSDRKSWEKMIRDYILARPNLMTLFVLVDARLEPQKIDLEFIAWLGESEIPFAIIFTKTDKLSSTKKDQSISLYKRILKKNWESLPPLIQTSSVSGLGKEEILTYVDETNHWFQA